MNKLNIFKYFSKTYLAGLIALLGYLAIQFGVANEGEWSELVAVVAQAVGIIGVMADRVSKKDISLFGQRKN